MKKHTKLMSMILAVLIVVTSISSTFAAFAEDSYKPQYTQKVTEEDVSALIGDINTILADKVLTGSVIESIYKMLPQMKSLLMLDGSSAKASDKALFYKELQPERFADLPDGQIVADTYDEDGNLVTEGTFTAFFKEHPIVCKNMTDFQKEMNILIDTIVVQNIMDTLPFAFLMAGSLDAGIELGNGLDEVCTALGIKQEKKAADVMGFNLMTGVQADREGTKDYLKNIIAAVLPDPANSIIDMLQLALSNGNAQKLYSGVTKILNSLDGCVKGLSATLSSLGIDIAAVEATIENIKNTFAALPTTGEDADKHLDIQGVVGYLISNLTSNAVGIKFGNNPSPSATVVLNFTEMKLDRIINAESNADTIKIVYDYLYNNLIGNGKTNMLLFAAIDSGIIESALGITLPEEVKSFITDAFAMKNDELANELIVMVADIAGREIPAKPETPVAPTEPTKPETPSNPTDDKKEPSNPSKPVLGNNNSSDKNSNKTDSSDKKLSSDSNNKKLIKSSSIPNTGIGETDVNILSVTAAELTVIALALIAYTVKKKKLFRK